MNLKSNKILITAEWVEALAPPLFYQELYFSIKNEKEWLTYNIKLQRQNLTLSIESKECILCSDLYDYATSYLKLVMIFKGRFPKITTIKFGLITLISTELRALAEYYLKNPLSMYDTSAHYDSVFDFNRNYFDELPKILLAWLKLDQEHINLSNKLFFYCTSSAAITNEMKLALISQCFEPIYDHLIKINIFKSKDTSAQRDAFYSRVKKLLIEDDDHVWEYVNKKEFFSSLSFSIKKHFWNKIDFFSKLNQLLIRYGSDIFQQNIKNDENFLQRIVNNRNRVFHSAEKKSSSLPNQIQLAEFVMKLSILYRVIILELLEIDCFSYKQKLKELIAKIDIWVKDSQVCD